MKRQPTNRVPSLWATGVKDTPPVTNSPAGAGRSRTENGVFTLWIANAGAPIPGPAREKPIEQPFFRDDVRDSRPGSERGLHIASQVAPAHGGAMAGTSRLRNSLHFQTLRIFYRADGSARGVNVAMRLKSKFRRELCPHPQARLQYR